MLADTAEGCFPHSRRCFHPAPALKMMNECKECKMLEPIAGACPYDLGDQFCFHVSLVTNCGKCKKRLWRVQGLFPKDHVARNGTYNVYCCSKECCDKAKSEFDELRREDAEMIAMRREKIGD